MKIALIVPHVGRKNLSDPGKYVNTWQMEPTMIATLATLTPDDVEIVMVDERLGEAMVYNDVDLAAITCEAYTAKRTYEICELYRDRNIPTIVGGWHAMLAPEEVVLYADSVFVGYAELLWHKVISDLRAGMLKGVYRSGSVRESGFVIPDRSIYNGRSYFNLGCLETGRGCPLKCDFCSITAATKATYKPRLQDQIVADIETSSNKFMFLVEDNFFGNMRHAKRTLKALIPLGIRWVGQGTLALAHDEEVLELMQASGCAGLLIGFESFKEDTLQAMDKPFNIGMQKFGTYQELIRRIHKYNIAIYGTFVFGYDTDTLADFRETTERAIDYGIALGAFNHLLPFPGTAIYQRFKEEGRLIDDPWWLSPTYRYGQVPFQPRNMQPEELHEACLRARERFFSIPSIIRRAVQNPQGNFNSVSKVGIYTMSNWSLRREILEKDGLPLGNLNRRPIPKAQTNSIGGVYEKNAISLARG